MVGKQPRSLLYRKLFFECSEVHCESCVQWREGLHQNGVQGLGVKRREIYVLVRKSSYHYILAISNLKVNLYFRQIGKYIILVL